MESNSPQTNWSNNATQNSSQNPKHHPIALELVRLVNVFGFNQERKTITSKKLQFQGIVKSLNVAKVIQIRKIAMHGIKLAFDRELQVMFVGLRCALAAQSRCTFDGKICIKKARFEDVLKAVKITRKFEAVPNVTRKAIRFIQYFHVKRNIKVFQIIAFF